MEIARLILDYISVVIWPAVVITTCVVFRKQLIALLARIRHAELPGGVAVDLAHEIQEVKALSAKVQEAPTKPESKRGPSIPLTEANAPTDQAWIATLPERP